jgi:hypothetical protein
MCLVQAAAGARYFSHCYGIPIIHLGLKIALIPRSAEAEYYLSPKRISMSISQSRSMGRKEDSS